MTDISKLKGVPQKQLLMYAFLFVRSFVSHQILNPSINELPLDYHTRINYKMTIQWTHTKNMNDICAYSHDF